MGVLERVLQVEALQRVERVDLGEFDEAYRGAVFEVWVTPTRAHVEAWGEIREWLERSTEEARVERERYTDPGRRAEFDQEQATLLEMEYEERVLRWLAGTWLNVELEEARKIREHLLSSNPRAWEWLVHRTHTTIGEFKRRLVGNSRGG